MNINSNLTKKLITLNEFSSLFKVSRPTIHNWINLGIIKRHKLGRRSYIDLDHAYKSMGITQNSAGHD